MAISFIPVRDQARVITGNRSSAENKGQVLKRLATGKKVADPRDDVADYRKISNMRTSLDSYKNAIKEVSFGVNKFETALSVTQSLMELYTTLGSKLNELKEAKLAADTAGLNTQDRAYYEAEINAMIDAINNTVDTKFDSETITGTDTAATPGKLELVVKTKGYNDTIVETTKFAKIFKINNANGSTTDKNKVELKDDDGTARTPDVDITSLITKATDNVTKADNNYRLILSGITNLSNIDALAQVQKTNTEAAISALEDIDVQEEMINLMQAQILEELSSEALIKIKESSKYIVNLIRA